MRELKSVLSWAAPNLAEYDMYIHSMRGEKDELRRLVATKYYGDGACCNNALVSPCDYRTPMKKIPG